MLIIGSQSANLHAPIRTKVVLTFRAGQSIDPLWAIEASKAKAIARRSANVHVTTFGLEAADFEFFNHGQLGFRLLRTADRLKPTGPSTDVSDRREAAIRNKRGRS